MDSATHCKVLTVLYVLLRRVSAVTQILVTADQCGRTIDLDANTKLNVNLEYKGADVGTYNSPCVIDFINVSDDEMLCSQTDSPFDLNYDCLFVFRYYVGGHMTKQNSYHHSCSEMNLEPLCDRNKQSSVVYHTSSMYKNGSSTVRLFTKKYTRASRRARQMDRYESQPLDASTRQNPPNTSDMPKTNQSEQESGIAQFSYDWGPPEYDAAVAPWDKSSHGTSSGHSSDQYPVIATTDNNGYQTSDIPELNSNQPSDTPIIHNNQSSDMQNATETQNGAALLDEICPPPSYESLNLHVHHH